MNYLGSNRVITNSFNTHKTAEDYAGNHLSNILMYGQGKVIKIINKFVSHEDSINYNDYLSNSKSWYNNGIYKCISITGKEVLMTSEELGGNQIFIETYVGNKKLLFRFAHLANVNVQVGDIVSSSTILGTQGNTGLVLSNKDYSDETYGSHVHLEITDENNNYIDPRKYASGEITTTYVKQTNERDEKKRQFIVNVDVINIREKATTESTDLGNVYLNEIYTILDTVTDNEYDWYKITTNTGITGYVASSKTNKWTTILEEKKEETNTDSKQEDNFIFECIEDDYYYIYLKKGEKLYLKGNNK